MVRRLAFLMLAIALVPVATAHAQGDAAKTVGIRLVDAPSNRSDDPRAHVYIVDHLAPGTTISRRVEVQNNTDNALAVQLYAAAASVDGGVFRFADGHDGNDLTSWTTLDPTSVTLTPGARALSTVKIAVPANASEGERYGVVWAELPPATQSGGGVTAVNRVGVRIYLSVGPGGEPPSDFSITTLRADRTRDGAPQVVATVKNTGGRALDLSGELRLTEGPGGLSAGPFNATLGTTLGVGQTEPVVVPLDRAIPAGPWEAHMTLKSGTTQRDASARITFPKSGSGAAVGTGSGGSSWLPVVVAIAVVALVGLLVLLWRRRRRDEESDTAAS